MDYSRFVVDPWKNADWGQAERIGARRQAMGLANRKQDIAERRMGLEERAFQSSEKDRELSAKEKKQRIQDARSKMLMRQLEFLYNGMESVDSQESLDNFNKIVDQLESAGAIDPAIGSQGKIEIYDPKEFGMVRKQLKSVIGKIEKGEYGEPYVDEDTGALIQKGPSGEAKKVAGPAKYETVTTIDKEGKTHIRSVKKGGELELPEGEMTIRQYESEKGGGKKDSRSNMSKEIDEIMATEKITRKEALKKWRADKSYPQRIKLYNDTVRQIMDDPSLDAEAQTRHIEEARKDFLPEHTKEEEQFDWDSVELPEGVTKEDVEFTAKKHGVSIDEVIKRLKK